MKKKGSVCEFSSERNAALKKVYCRLLADASLHTVADIYEAMAHVPAPRFFVSEMRALTVIRHRQRTGEFPVMVASRLRMFEEIWNRYNKLRALKKTMSDFDIIFEIINSEAPSFYLTPGSMRTILCRA